MAGWKKRILGACFVLHFSFILLISIRQGTSDLARGTTLLGHSFDPIVHRADYIAAALLGEHQLFSHPWRQAVAVYMHAAGLDTGYGFFAPLVPVSHKLVFEIRYPDGRVE